jgi:hypothetical protein
MNNTARHLVKMPKHKIEQIGLSEIILPHFVVLAKLSAFNISFRKA